MNWVIIGSGNSLSLVRRQAITWTNADLLLIVPLGTSFNEVLIGILSFSFKKVHLKMSPAETAAILPRGRWVELKSCKVSFAHSLFHICSIDLKWCTLHSSDTGVICVKYQKHVKCENWKGCYWLTRFCKFWVWDEFRMDIRLHWTAPLEPDFSAIPCHASQTNNRCD